MARRDKIGKHKTKVTDHLNIRGERIATVTYHRTQVFWANLTTGDVVLDTGGRNTPATRRRINQAAKQFGLEFSVFSQKGIMRAAGNALESENISIACGRSISFNVHELNGMARFLLPNWLYYALIRKRIYGNEI